MTDEVADDDVEEVVENVALCSECDDYMEHEVLKERKVGTGRDLLIKCISCSAISNLQIREPKSVSVPFILTDGIVQYVLNYQLMKMKYSILEMSLKRMKYCGQ